MKLGETCATAKGLITDERNKDYSPPARDFARTVDAFYSLTGHRLTPAKETAMKLVFVAGPYRGANAWEVTQNCNQAEALGYKVAQLGAMPVIPHMNTRNFDGTLTDEFWLDGTMELMLRCDALIATEDWPKSRGAQHEVQTAVGLDKPVFYDIDSLRIWLDNQ